MTRRVIKIYRDLFGDNERWATATRELAAQRGWILINLIGSPGSGKTALLESVIRHHPRPESIAVLEGDIATTRDAERIAALNVPVSQLITGGACHLEARLVHEALKELPESGLRWIFVENVGNMVCPAEFDIGEHAKIAVLSVAEGEDKPLKYPMLFRQARAVVLTKIDLLPHLRFDVAQCEAWIRQINDRLPVFRVCALTGDGVDPWLRWLSRSFGGP